MLEPELYPDPAVLEVTEDTADVDRVLDVVVVVVVTTVPEAANWLAPRASIMETSSTVAPLIKISSSAPDIWNNEPKPCVLWLGTITTVKRSGANC